MKKLVTAACALVAGIAMADGVQSANVVGFTEINGLSADEYALAAIQFQTTDSQSAKINDILTCSVGTPSWEGEGDDEHFVDDWYEDAAQLMVRFGNGYRAYYYCSQADRDVDGDTVYIPGWANDSANYLENVTLDPGIGVWFKAPKNVGANFRTMGQVIMSASFAVSGAAGYSLVANPYPVAFNINSAKINWGLVGTPSWEGEGDDEHFVDDWYESAPQLMVRFGNGYRAYYYCSQADRDVDGDTVYIPGWANDSANYLENIVIGEGAGFWLKANAAFTTTTTL